jgi:hypothetical protein
LEFDHADLDLSPQSVQCEDLSATLSGIQKSITRLFPAPDATEARLAPPEFSPGLSLPAGREQPLTFLQH